MTSRLLKEGLTIISQCKSMTGDIWHAHIGAAAIASYFIAERFDLPETAVDHIMAESHKMLDTHTLSPTIDGLSGMEYSQAEQQILESLEETIDQLHWVGHNVIYSAYSLLAIKTLGRWGEAQDIENIAQLIRAFKGTIPGRSWINSSAKEVKRMEIAPEDHFPSIETAQQLSKFILAELSSFRTIYHAEAHHDLLGHMLTFSHALNVLFDLGHAHLFRRGLPPLFKLVKALRLSKDIPDITSIQLVSPVDKLPLERKERANVVPFEPAYWERDYSHLDWDFGHLFKFTYSYYDHIQRAPHMKNESIENFRYVVCH